MLTKFKDIKFLVNIIGVISLITALSSLVSTQSKIKEATDKVSSAEQRFKSLESSYKESADSLQKAKENKEKEYKQLQTEHEKLKKEVESYREKEKISKEEKKDEVAAVPQEQNSTQSAQSPQIALTQKQPVQQRTSIVQKESSQSVHYKNCKEAKARGAAPIYAGQPGYAPHLDRDGDGIACEK